MKPLSRQAQALIDAARAAEVPSDEYHAHMRRKLQAQLGAAMGAAAVTMLAPKAAAGVTATAPHAPAAKTGANGAAIHAATAGPVAKAGITLVILGVLAGGGTLLWRQAHGDRGAAVALEGITAFANSLALPSLPPAPPSPQPAPAVAEASEAPAPPARSAHPRRAPAAAPASSARRPAPDTALNDELALLSRAQGALSSGQADRALELLKEHSAAYPAGALREERQAALVFALCALGRRDEARAEAQRFVLESPRSPLAARVRTACPAGNSPGPDAGPEGESSTSTP